MPVCLLLRAHLEIHRTLFSTCPLKINNMLWRLYDANSMHGFAFSFSQRHSVPLSVPDASKQISAEIFKLFPSFAVNT